MVLSILKSKGNVSGPCLFQLIAIGLGRRFLSLELFRDPLLGVLLEMKRTPFFGLIIGFLKGLFTITLALELFSLQVFRS